MGQVGLWTVHPCPSVCRTCTVVGHLAGIWNILSNKNRNTTVVDCRRLNRQHRRDENRRFCNFRRVGFRNVNWCLEPTKLSSVFQACSVFRFSIGSGLELSRIQWARNSTVFFASGGANWHRLNCGNDAANVDGGARLVGCVHRRQQLLQLRRVVAMVTCVISTRRWPILILVAWDCPRHFPVRRMRRVPTTTNTSTAPAQVNRAVTACTELHVYIISFSRSTACSLLAHIAIAFYISPVNL